MKKIVSVVLAVMFLCLAVGIVNANVTPVEVERIKNVCFVRVRGVHHLTPDPMEKYDSGFLLHYENLDVYYSGDLNLKVQYVHVEYWISPPEGIGWMSWTIFIVPPKNDLYERPNVIDKLIDTAPFGSLMDFIMNVYIGDSAVPTVTISDTVVIPPA